MAVDENSNRGFIIVVVAILALAVFASNLQGSNTGYATLDALKNCYKNAASEANKCISAARASRYDDLTTDDCSDDAKEAQNICDNLYGRSTPTRTRNTALNIPRQQQYPY